MKDTQAKAFMNAIKASGISVYEFVTSLNTHLYNDGKRSIAKCDMNKGCCVGIRSTATAGTTSSFADNVQVVMANFDDVHEVRTAGTYEQVKAFVESFGLDLTTDELKIILEIDKHNYDINPATGDYNGFKYLSSAEYLALSEEDKAKYDAEKAKYEDSKTNPGKNQAARIII